MLSSVTQSCLTFATPWTAACQASPSITNSQSLFNLMSIKSVMPFNHLILCPPLLLLPSVFPRMRIFSSILHNRWPSIGASALALVLPVNIQDWFHLGLIGWISLQSREFSRVFNTTVQSISSLVLSFFMVQLSHPYMITGKTITLTRWTFVVKVISLLFNMLSGLVIAFFPRSKHLLISWLQSPSAMILKPKKINSVTVSVVSPSIWHEVTGLDVMIFVFWLRSF